MSVIDCPVCGQAVNAEATRCPECGADPRLPPDEALATLATLYLPPPARPRLPGWSRRRRVVLAVPALLLPLAFLLLGVVVLVDGLMFYYSLPAALRAADYDAIVPADAGIELGIGLLLFGLLAAALGVAATLPRRLDSAMAACVLILGLGLVGFVAWAGWVVGPWWLCLPFVYVPVLTVVRLRWQSSPAGSRPVTA